MEIHMNKPGILATLVILMLVLAACPSTPTTPPPTTPPPTTTPPTTPTPTPTATSTPTPTPTPTPTGPSVTIDLVAHNIAFDLSTITVPAGAAVTVNFTNEDSGIPHNFAVYETSAAQQAIFQGQIITGPSSITYHFTAPSTPGDYFFRCDVHPTIMTGTFVVTSS
jgi:plastocyanin